MLKKLLILIIFLVLTSCYQTTSESDLNTNPVTNNPNIVPSNYSIFPN